MRNVAKTWMSYILKISFHLLHLMIDYINLLFQLATHRCCWFLDQKIHHWHLLLLNLLLTIVSPQLVSLQCLPPLMRGDKIKLFIRAFSCGHTSNYAHLTSSHVGFSNIYYLLIVTPIWIVLPGVSSFFPCLKVLVSNLPLHRTIKRINSQSQK